MKYKNNRKEVEKISIMLKLVWIIGHYVTTQELNLKNSESD